MVAARPGRRRSPRGAALLPCAALVLGVLASRDAAATHGACVELTEPDGCRSRSEACTSFFRAEFEAARTFCVTSESERHDRRRCRREYRRVFREGRTQCAELLRSCRACCRSGGDQVCAVARRIECDVGCEQQDETWADMVRELLDKCVATGDSGDREERKEHKRSCKEVYKTNRLARKLARSNCRSCCDLGGHDASCQVPPVLCGDDAVGEGEACDGHDDAACPGQCAFDCTCGSSPIPAFMSYAPGAL